MTSREHVSAVAVAAPVHTGRVLVPCASSATLGNSTERVNGRPELERRFGYSRWSRFLCRIVLDFFLIFFLKRVYESLLCGYKPFLEHGTAQYSRYQRYHLDLGIMWNKTARLAVGAASTSGVGRYVMYHLLKIISLTV